MAFLRSAPQCLLERRRKGVVGCDQLVAFAGWIGEADSWARLAMVRSVGSSHSDSHTWSRVAVVVGMMLVICGPSSTPAALGKFLMGFHHLTGATYYPKSPRPHQWWLQPSAVPPSTPAIKLKSCANCASPRRFLLWADAVAALA